MLACESSDRESCIVGSQRETLITTNTAETYAPPPRSEQGP